MIFYFSATGNCRAAAEQIAEATGDKTVSITDILRSPKVPVYSIENEPLGFVLPVYYDDLPTIISDFITRVGFNPEIGTYIYLVLCCADHTGLVQRKFNQLLERDGLKLAACYVVSSPGVHLAEGTTPDQIREQMDRMTDEVSRIIPKIVAKKKGVFNAYKGAFAEVHTWTMGLEYQAARKTKYFSVDALACDHCGICAGVCPGFDITMSGDPAYPVWTVPECCLCMGCYEECPTGAIAYKGKFPDPRYLWRLYEQKTGQSEKQEDGNSEK